MKSTTPAGRNSTHSVAVLDKIIASNHDTLLAYATKLAGGDRHRAEDALQEVWLRAWHRIDRLDEDHGSVRGWLLRVTHNVVIDQHRRRSARPTEVPIDTGFDRAVQTDSCDDLLTSVAVRGALNGLAKKHRETLVEVYLRDRTAAQAATVLRVPVGTVKSRLHFALRSLRELLQTPAVEAWG
jgi:RNA polymerase sigma-70 factor, ECF subfamily